MGRPPAPDASRASKRGGCKAPGNPSGAATLDGNGNDRRNGEKAVNYAEAEARVQAAVTTLARLLGRQIAREQFERLIGTSDNAQARKGEDRHQDV